MEGMSRLLWLPQMAGRPCRISASPRLAPALRFGLIATRRRSSTMYIYGQPRSVAGTILGNLIDVRTMGWRRTWTT